MDQNLQKVIDKRIEKTVENLKKNQMEAYYVQTCAEAVELVDRLCQPGETVAVGGSMTLFEAGIIDHINSGKYHHLNRYDQGADVSRMMRDAFSADTYFTSTNALTEEGELYNVDGNGNRVAAMLFGPRQVIVVAGYNKIVEDMDAAVRRVEKVAAPANVARLGLASPCAQTGECVHCRSKGRICCDYVRMGMQRTPGRVKVIIVGQQLGY
ncbi:MAG: lactate utilization protein [Oscillospiraceae bacterium]|nr:lactate utilization protein [Oscillospiraceae bacterium]